MAGNREQDVEDFRSHLVRIGACPEGLAWSRGRTAKEAWEQCDYPSWLIWWATRTNVNAKPSVIRVVNKLRHHAGFSKLDTTSEVSYLWLWVPAMYYMDGDPWARLFCDLIRARLKIPWDGERLDRRKK